MDTITDTATTTTTRGCRHAECKRKGKTFKTAAGRTWHLVNIHGVGVKAEPTPEPTPLSEAPKLEGKRLEDDRELRGPAGKRAKRTRTTRHEGNVACMNVHTGTHAAWAQADVVAEAEAIVAETPAPTSVDAHLQALALGYVQLSDRIDVIEAQIRVGA